MGKHTKMIPSYKALLVLLLARQTVSLKVQFTTTKGGNPMEGELSFDGATYFIKTDNDGTWTFFDPNSTNGIEDELSAGKVVGFRNSGTLKMCTDKQSSEAQTDGEPDFFLYSNPVLSARR